MSHITCYTFSMEYTPYEDPNNHKMPVEVGSPHCPCCGKHVMIEYKGVWHCGPCAGVWEKSEIKVLSQ